MASDQGGESALKAQGLRGRKVGVGAPRHMVSELRVQRIILRARQTLNVNFVLSPLLPSVTQFFDSQSPWIPH